MIHPSRALRVVAPIALVIIGFSAFPGLTTTPGSFLKDDSIDFWNQLPKLPKPLNGLGSLGLAYDAEDVVPSAEESLVVSESVGTYKDCSMCGVAPELCERVGERKIIKSQSFLGTGDRIRRFLAKARTGDGFTVSVIGGSVSYGHGLGDYSNAISTMLVHRIIFDHLNELFPAREGVSIGGYKKGKNSFVNGAIGATGSDYFAYCFSNHIHEETDLVLLELGINDELKTQSFETYELLLRGLLDMPSQPAVLSLQVFALLFWTMAMGGDVHHGAAQYYDVPMISLRNAILPDILANHSLVQEYFAPLGEGVDTRHMGRAAHRLLGELGNAYIDSQICEVEKRGLDKLTFDEWEVEPVPRIRLMNQYKPDTAVPRMSPTCLSTNTQGKNKLVATASEGWREWSFNDKTWLIADEPGSKISFDFFTALGGVDLFFLRSKEFKLGNAACWVDDDRDKAVTLKGYWTNGYNIGQRTTIRDNLKPGEHTLHCEVLDTTDDPDGGKEFRIISLMSL